MHKKRKKMRKFGLSMAIGFLLSIGVLFWCFVELPEVLFHWVTTYKECDAEKMFAYVGDRYSITFPDEIENRKAAKTPKSPVDSGSSFILKFDAASETVGNFFASSVEFRPYSEQNDSRLSRRAPDWCKKAIIQGKMAVSHIRVPTSQNMSFAIDIFVDTANDKKNTVYIMGVYTSEADQNN